MKREYLHEYEPDVVARHHAYFGELTTLPTADIDPNIADRFGLVSYPDLTTNQPPKDEKIVYDELSIILRGLVGILTSVVLTKAGSDLEKRHDPDLWIEALSRGLGAFFADTSEGTEPYDQRVVGRQIAEEVLALLTQARVEENRAYTGFSQFLQRQGQEARAKAGNRKAGYRYGTVEMLHEITDSTASGWVYHPRVSLRFTEFTDATFPLTSACTSRRRFRFQFRVRHYTASFKKDTWRSEPAFRQMVRRFIKDYNKTDIPRSKNYYRGVFTSTPLASTPASSAAAEAPGVRLEGSSRR